MAKMRLDKFLGNMGVGSRKEVKLLVRWGRVNVNGIRAWSSSDYMDTEKDKVDVDGEEITYIEYVYIMMNKPQGYVSATEDSRDHTVLELVPEQYAHFDLFPVGRLDKNTEGLMLLTNDGKLAHGLLSPKKHVKKRYFAKVAGCVNADDIKAFKEGVIIDDYKTMPAGLEILKADEESEVMVIIKEGKYHQIKRMFMAREKEVVYLQRLSIGTLQLDKSLELGECRLLTDRELEDLKKGAGLEE